MPTLGSVRVETEPAEEATADQKASASREQASIAGGLWSGQRRALTTGLAGLTLTAGSSQVVLGSAALVLGLGVTVPSLRRLLPDGTFTARPGLPAVILCRGLLTFTFFGAPTDREGWASASLSLADVLGTAFGIGAGGAAVAAATAHNWPLGGGVAVAFALAGAGAVGLSAARRRLPESLADTGPSPAADG
jgi:hypothetical protein